jgi:hypothetical protein
MQKVADVSVPLALVWMRGWVFYVSYSTIKTFGKVQGSQAEMPMRKGLGGGK